jgi:hypothetical protein
MPSSSRRRPRDAARGALTCDDFYNRLERAILRSERARLIDGRVVELED